MTTTSIPEDFNPRCFIVVSRGRDGVIGQQQLIPLDLESIDKHPGAGFWTRSRVVTIMMFVSAVTNSLAIYIHLTLLAVPQTDNYAYGKIR